MKTINVVAASVLGWLLVVGVQNETQQPKEKIIYVSIPAQAEGCGCDVCDNCSCVESKTCVTCKEVAVDDTAANFPRPRKPCPIGPGRK